MALKEKLASVISRDARLRQAIAQLESGDDAVKGFKALGQLAQQGNVEAQYRTGKAYLEGWGTPPSLEDGTRWVRKAAEAGHVQARLTLATLYLVGFPEGFDENRATIMRDGKERKRVPDLEQAAHWSRLAANEGQPDAQALLGYVLTNGPESLRNPAEAREWYEKSASAGSAQGHLGLGMALHSDPKSPEDLARGTAELVQAADAGLATAFYFLAWINEQGIGQAQDLAAAARYFEKAAERGIVQAQTRFALYLLQGKGLARRPDRAETWLRRAALGGDAEAAALLGDLHIRGEEMAPNYLEAATWYQVAAELGHGAAARGLGLLYLTGTGVHRDPDEAARWFRVSAECGDRVADADLGNLALTGIGSEEGRVAMQKRFLQAAENGDLVGAFNVGVCYAEGVGTERDDARAAYWMQRAADGVVNAQYWLGRMYLEGRGVREDAGAAVQWLEKAAQARMTEAMILLAQLFVSGRVPKGRDHARALSLYVEAAQHGSVEAMFSAGAMLGGGHDVPVDRREAQRFFRLAAERGHALGQLMLGRYLKRGLAGEVNPVEARIWLERAQSQGVDEASPELAKLERRLGTRPGGQTPAH
ncbi:tetratricopeptide repeat protein [Asaia spathodeae]|uniref:Sel1 repeat family protein n=1 Tax=Asaia spathodeae TaxID=657016 RepID=A0ABX2P3A1_9PROT|nr:tetratricopeptide repeat protein [Asaia spathodeae]GBR21495.1 tetratricopeptide repeat family protein [Asaia spathodeae NBRC 105894]